MGSVVSSFLSEGVASESALLVVDFEVSSAVGLASSLVVVGVDLVESSLPVVLVSDSVGLASLVDVEEDLIVDEVEDEEPDAPGIVSRGFPAIDHKFSLETNSLQTHIFHSATYWY